MVGIRSIIFQFLSTATCIVLASIDISTDQARKNHYKKPIEIDPS